MMRPKTSVRANSQTRPPAPRKRIIICRRWPQWRGNAQCIRANKHSVGLPIDWKCVRTHRSLASLAYCYVCIQDPRNPVVIGLFANQHCVPCVRPPPFVYKGCTLPSYPFNYLVYVYNEYSNVKVHQLHVVRWRCTTDDIAAQKHYPIHQLLDNN